MKHGLWAILAGSALLSLPAPASAQTAADAPVIQLVRDVVEAERRFDQARLAELTTGDYAEVSPLGDLDLRTAFLGFYAADKKQPAPPISVSEPLVRHWGDTASIIARLSFERPGPEGQPAQTLSMRASYLAVRSGGKWKLASAQYTPVRKPAAKP